VRDSGKNCTLTAILFIGGVWTFYVTIAASSSAQRSAIRARVHCWEQHIQLGVHYRLLTHRLSTRYSSFNHTHRLHTSYNVEMLQHSTWSAFMLSSSWNVQQPTGRHLCILWHLPRSLTLINLYTSTNYNSIFYIQHDGCSVVLFGERIIHSFRL